MKVTTRAQREAVLKLFERDYPNIVREMRGTFFFWFLYRRFRKKFQWYYGDYIGGEWKGMFVGIESDGYTHT